MITKSSMREIAFDDTLQYFRYLVRKNSCRLIGLSKGEQTKILLGHGWDNLEVIEIIETIDAAWNEPIL